jgi:hypothetical protein
MQVKLSFALSAPTAAERQLFSASLGSSGGFMEDITAALKVGFHDRVPTFLAETENRYRAKRSIRWV